MSIQKAYHWCADVTRRDAGNFRYAFPILDGARKRALYAVYAFCRTCDDIADGGGSSEEKRRRLEGVRKELNECYAGRSRHPLFIALQDAVQRFHIPLVLLEDVIRGVKQDLVIVRYHTFDELQVYCHRVASAVGLISLEIFGYRDPVARIHAAELGVAMQLTNILRDIREDAERGRMYLPLEELDRFGVWEREVVDGRWSLALSKLIDFHIDRARRFFERGERLLGYLPRRARSCPAILARIYREILNRIDRNPSTVFCGRVSLSPMHKVWLASTAFLKSVVA